jgi:hypothetical protein
MALMRTAVMELAKAACVQERSWEGRVEASPLLRAEVALYQSEAA